MSYLSAPVAAGDQILLVQLPVQCLPKLWLRHESSRHARDVGERVRNDGALRDWTDFGCTLFAWRLRRWHVPA